MIKADIVKRARRLLHDEDKPYRWEADAMHDAIVDAVRALNSITPSTKYVNGAYCGNTVVPADNAEDQTIAVDDHFAEGLSFYAAAVCYSLDDPDNQNAALSDAYRAKAQTLFRL